MKKLSLLLVTTIIAFGMACGGTTEKAPEAVQNAPFPIIGTKIPAAELDAFHKGALTAIKLSSYKGKWLILFFYPADFSFVCLEYDPNGNRTRQVEPQGGAPT